MFRVSRSRFLVAILFLLLVFPTGVFTTQTTAGAQTATRSSREAELRSAVELPLFLDETAAQPPITERATANLDMPWSQIVYYDRNFDKWDVFILTDDGENRQQLTHTKWAEVDPDLSRGGGTVVYASNEDGDFEIFAMSAQGAGAHALTRNSKDDGQPRFSPDNSRIVFVSERDGQAEVYTMKPDGSDQKRLTFNNDYDGDPAWSPDGKQIAFSSRRNGVYRIWVMNADGSDQRQLSTTPYSLAPVWSPNGEQIVFSAEGDTDGWLDLVLINVDGSDEHKLHNATGAADAIARSWSPDGNQVAFTQWNYVPYQGQWYIGSTYLMRLEPGEFYADMITNGPQYPFGPAWQSLDTKAPQSALAALPAQSPAEVTVSWSGTDSGGSGLRVYDVQMRLNDGEWTLWKKGTGEPSAVYTGTAGQRLAFRVRARDFATNLEPWPARPQALTTIESLPPQSAMLPLPLYTRVGQPFTVAWDGLDPGGSGITGFTVQYRVTSGTWMTLLADTLEGSVEFSPENKGVAPGQTVTFRVRAIDKAQNMEAWPQESGDTATTLYTWAAAGRITDNTGVPIGGASVVTTPGPIHPTTSGLDGEYRAYGKDAVASVLLTWAKPGYGPLPPSLFATAAAAEVDAVLPPADNVVGDGSFEGS